MNSNSTDLINGVVALVEGRPESANPILREFYDRKSRVDLSARLYSALDKRERDHGSKVLRNILIAALRLEAPSDVDDTAFLLGVKAVEDIIEKVLSQEE